MNDMETINCIKDKKKTSLLQRVVVLAISYQKPQYFNK